jgi:preprotein translocase subunit SecE
MRESMSTDVAVASKKSDKPGFVTEVRQEMKKVIWPTKEELQGAGTVIIIVTFIVSLVFGLMDLVLFKILDLLLRIG